MPRTENHADAGQPKKAVLSGPKVRPRDKHSASSFETVTTTTLEQPRTRSFARPAAAIDPLESLRGMGPHTPPMPKRPKGKLLVGFFLWSLVGLAAFATWDAFFRYEAHGVVSGAVITVGAPWDGVVKSLHVREGASFRNGDLLATLDNIELRQALDQLHGQLKLAQAQLDAKIAELRYKTLLDDDRTKEATAELYELWGNVLRERANLLELRSTKARYARIPKDAGVISEQERQRVEIAEAGQTAKVKKMIDAVRQLQERVNEPQDEAQPSDLQPEIVRIDGIQKKIAHLRAQIIQGEVRAGLDGTIIKRLHFTGEHVKESDGLFEVLEEGSKELVLYVRQQSVDRFKLDQQLHLRIDPLGHLVRCRIVRVGSVLVPAPPAIDHYYRKNEQLVPIYLQTEEQGYGAELRLGCEIKLPIERRNQLSKWWQAGIDFVRYGEVPTDFRTAM